MWEVRGGSVSESEQRPGKLGGPVTKPTKPAELFSKQTVSVIVMKVLFYMILASASCSCQYQLNVLSYNVPLKYTEAAGFLSLSLSLVGRLN